MVSIGNEESRASMRVWFERWEADKRKNGLFELGSGKGVF
jgi:DNA cross-link repair 1A protein